MKDWGSDMYKVLNFVMRWETYNVMEAFEDGSWIQNWAQWEDEDAPGKYEQMTCNA